MPSLQAVIVALELLAPGLPLAVPAQSQVSTGSIQGQVTDISGAVTPGANITVTSKATGRTFNTMTGSSSGTYLITGLVAGEYALTAQSPGFRRFTVSLAVEAGKITSMNAVLDVAGGKMVFPSPVEESMLKVKHKVIGRYPLPDAGSLDYVTLDSSSRKLYVSHGTQVDVADADTGAIVGTIADAPGVSGVAVAAAFRHGFICNGRENRVTMFDLSTLEFIKTIEVGKGPDGIYYEPGSRRVFANNRGSRDITAIDAGTGELVGTVRAGCNGRQAVAGSNGLIYVAGEETNEVVVFDPVSLEVNKRFPLVIAQRPAALTYHAKSNRLFIGCRDSSMVVMDASTGMVMRRYEIDDDPSWAGFDPGSRLIFFSCAGGQLDIFWETSVDDCVRLSSVPTELGARAVALDPKTNRIFLPVAEYRVDTTRTGWPAAAKPGTSAILVVGKS
jgi:outer membrane protein assembly factor BamB